MKPQQRQQKRTKLKKPQRTFLFKQPYLDYRNWVNNRFHSYYRVCASGVYCDNQGGSCKYDHVAVWTQSEYIHRLQYYHLEDQLYELIQKFQLDQQTLLKPDVPQSTQQYKDALERSKKLKHMLQDHGKKYFDTHCNDFASSKCKELGYYKDPQTLRLQRVQKIKQNQSLMNNVLGFGKYKHQTWAQVQKNNPRYIDWIVKNFRDDDFNTDIATEIISRRKKKPSSK